MVYCKIIFDKKSSMAIESERSTHHFYAKDFFKTFVMPLLEPQLSESMLELITLAVIDNIAKIPNNKRYLITVPSVLPDHFSLLIGNRITFFQRPLRLLNWYNPIALTSEEYNNLKMELIRRVNEKFGDIHGEVIVFLAMHLSFVYMGKYESFQNAIVAHERQTNKFIGAINLTYSHNGGKHVIYNLNTKDMDNIKKTIEMERNKAIKFLVKNG